jgi:hypothetical protein
MMSEQSKWQPAVWHQALLFLQEFEATGEVKIDGYGERIFDFTDFEFNLAEALNKSHRQWYVRCPQEDMVRWLAEEIAL